MSRIGQALRGALLLEAEQRHPHRGLVRHRVHEERRPILAFKDRKTHFTENRKKLKI